MPLPNDAEEHRQQLESLQSEITQSGLELQKLNRLDKLVTAGGPPDFSDLSDEELRETFDVAMGSTMLNNLPDGFNQNSGRFDIGKQHPYSFTALQDSGIMTSERSREDMIEGLKQLMLQNGNNMGALVNEVKAGAAHSRAELLSGAITEMEGNHDHLVKNGQAQKGDDLEQQRTNLKQQVRVFQQRSEAIGLETDRKKLQLQAISDLRKKGGNFVDAADKLEVALQERNPERFAAQMFQIMREHDDSDVGVAVGKVVLAQPDGKKMANEIGKQVMKAELSNPQLAIKNFLRNNHAINGLTKEVIEQTSPELLQTMRDAGRQARQGVDMEGGVNAGRYTETFDRVGVELSNNYVDALANIQLTDETKQYLQGLKDQLMSNDYAQVLQQRNDQMKAGITKEKLTSDYMANAVILRMAMPELIATTEVNNDLNMAAGSTAQTIANKMSASEDVSQLFIKEGSNANMVRQTFNDGRGKLMGMLQNNAKAQNEIEGMNVDLQAMGEELKEDLRVQADRLKQNRENQVRLQQQQEGVNVPQRVNQQNNGNQAQVQQRPQRRSVREVLQAAKESIKKTLGLDDASKLKRAEKQLDKREDLVRDLKQAKLNLEERLSKDPLASALQKPYDPLKAINGSTEQMEIAEARQLNKMREGINKRIERNEVRVEHLKEKVADLHLKVERKQQVQNNRGAHL